MTGITSLLETAADDLSPVETLDVAADLRRGHRALGRRRRRTWATGALAASVLGVGAATLRLDTVGDRAIDPATPGASDTIHYRFTFGPGAHLPDSAAILRLSFLGTGRPDDLGDPVEHEGRTFYATRGVRDDVVTVLDPSGQWIRLQMTPPAGWTLGQSVDLLDHVQVERVFGPVRD
jgi:hypothetical protein